MRTIQELTRDTQILCDSDEQRTAVFALCEAAGKRMFLSSIILPFSQCPNVIVDDVWYSECDEYPCNPSFDEIPATEFLTDKKAEI